MLVFNGWLQANPLCAVVVRPNMDPHQAEPREMEYDMGLAVLQLLQLQQIPGVAPLQISVYPQAATLMHSGNLEPYLQSYDEYRHIEYW